MSTTTNRLGRACLGPASALGALLLLAACGSPAAPPQAGGPTSPGAPNAQDKCADSKVVALAKELEGVTGQAREARLLDAAKAAGGEVTLYGELNVEEAGPLIEAFEEKYEDVSVGLYRAGTDQIRQRVLEEASAGRLGADVIELDATEMVQLDQNGVLSPASSPWADAVTPAGQFENFTADRFSYISPSWNTKKLASSDVPKTLEDLADPKYKGRLALEGSDVYWFAGLVQWLQEQKGMTKEQAVDLFKRIAANSSITDGHTTTVELVVSGQYDLAANTFAHRVVSLQKKGAPVEWQPTEIPVVAETTTVAVPCSAPNPAGALLLQDFFLDPEQGQKLFAELDRTPANVAVAEEQLGSSSVEPIDVDVKAVAASFAEWQQLWDEVVRQGGTS